MPPDSPSISLQKRYQLAAIALVFAILLITLWSQLSLHSIRSTASSGLDNRQYLLNTTDEIRNELLVAYRSLDGFLLDPGEVTNLATVQRTTDRTVSLSQKLLEHEWIIANDQVNASKKLISSLEQFNTELEVIIAVRKDIIKQYPAMAVANQQMRPARRAIDNAFLIAFNEMDSDQTITQQRDVYIKVNDLHRNWIQMLSNFRLYLANRVGSFNESALPVQEQAINTTYDEVRKNINWLRQQDEQGNLGFESSEALQQIKENIENWFTAYKDVVVIHSSGNWRVDSTLVKTKLIPLVDDINLQLHQLESRIQMYVDEDVSSYSNLAQSHMYLILFVTLSAVGMVFTFIWLSNRFLFHPLAILTNALRAESTGKSPLELPASRIKETQELVDAFVDMRHQVRLRQNELEYRALHDGLTSLPNRTLLMDHIRHDLQLAKRDGSPTGLLIIDLDRFKEINDTLGHSIGDQVLVEIGDRFKSSLRESDTVARLGGDEFAVLTPNTNIDGACKIAGDILDSLKESISINEMQLFVNASIGIAMHPDHGDDAQTLLQHADVAMYDAKQHQKGFSIYNPSNDQYSIKRLALTNDLRNAIENSEFSLHFQPIVPCQPVDNSYQAEALLRWNTAKHGDISPELIVNLAEQTGLISTLTEWVIDNALSQTKIWRDSGMDFCVSVNLSMYNLREEDLAEKIQHCLSRYMLPGNVLTLEITESAMMFNPTHVIKVLKILSDMGVRLSIDDFGTGFSSLAYLKQLPVNEIKIDKSFITDLANNNDDQMIVKTTLNLAENLGLGSVVEGVECSEALSLLKSFGCQHAQGYLFSQPLAANDYHNYIASRLNRHI